MKDGNRTVGTLDARHFGLRGAKERILEYLAAGGSVTRGAPVLCLAGPPDVGKSSRTTTPPTSASPRFRQLPDSRLVHVREPAHGRRAETSPTYNEMLRRTGGQDSLNARLDGPDDSSTTWGLRDPVDADGWSSSRIAMVTNLLPHIRQFVRVRQALVRAEARHTTLTALLDNPRVGVVHEPARAGPRRQRPRPAHSAER